MGMILLLTIPTLAIILSLLVGKKIHVVEKIHVISAVFETLVGIYLVGQIVMQHTYVFLPYVSLDAFSMLVLGITVVIGLVATLHGVGYFRLELAKEAVTKQKVYQSYILMRAFVLLMYLASMTANPIIMWISVEAITLTIVFLINFLNRPEDLEAAWKFLLINSVGLLFGLLGTLLFLSQGAGIGKLFVQWTDLMAVTRLMNPTLIQFAYIFVFLGYGTKMGFVPMHTWKPDTYNKAPMPVVALLSGALLNVALLAILRFTLITNMVVGVSFTQTLFVFFGIISIMLAGAIVYTQKNYKRMLAYSTIEHAGLILLGIGFGGIGVFGALLHMLYHSLGKALFFLLSSNVAVRYSSSVIQEVKGMLKVLPVTSVLYIFAFLFITGMPPFGMFFSEVYIFLGGLAHHWIILSIAAVMLLFVFIGFFRSVLHMVFSAPIEDMPKGEHNVWTLVPVSILAIVLVGISVAMPSFMQQLLQESVHILTMR